MIAEHDRGFTLGDGLFETILVKDGKPILLEAHLQRMAASARALGLPAPVQAAAQAKRAAEGHARAALRITWTAGSGGRGLDRPAAAKPNVAIAVHPSAPPGPAALILSTIRRHGASPAARHKTLSYIDNVLARREAAQRGADEALLLDETGRIASAAAANVFWIAEGRLGTPSLNGPLLPGIMRAEVLKAARALGLAVAEDAMEPGRLEDAEALFLTNSLIGLRPVARFEGRDLADHPWRVRLAEALADVT